MNPPAPDLTPDLATVLAIGLFLAAAGCVIVLIAQAGIYVTRAARARRRRAGAPLSEEEILAGIIAATERAGLRDSSDEAAP